MSDHLWQPSQVYTKREQYLVKRLARTRKLFAFLREHRMALFDVTFQNELAGMYRDTGAGRPPVPPALMAMIVLLQAYIGASDAEAVELTVVDLRWQMVLGRLGEEEPACSQGALCDFRARLIARDMDKRLLERTVELARASKGFDPKKVPRRIAMDSSPLEGAGRVEDTLNLLAHAARKVVGCVAMLMDATPDDVAREAGIPLLTGPSLKATLDIEWNDPAQRTQAMRRLIGELDSLETWIAENLPEERSGPPLSEHLDTLRTIRSQDLEPDPSGAGTRIRQGTATDRRISIEDKEMRHGRKSKSKRFNGFKRHLASDLDSGLILAAAITPANRPEAEAAPAMHADLVALDGPDAIGALYIDRGYIGSDTVHDVLARRGDVVCKPWFPRNTGLFKKTDFHIDMRRLTITCPAGQIERFTQGEVVEFDPEECARCPLRAKCTMAAPDAGRTVQIGENERLQHRLRKLIASPKGRSLLRERTGIEHQLARLSQKQGLRARYLGVRKNVFDLRRTAAVINLETVQRVGAAA